MQTATPSTKTAIQKMSLFPTMDSPEDVLELAKSKITSVERNELHSLFMTFQNTLLKSIYAGNKNII